MTRTAAPTAADVDDPRELPLGLAGAALAVTAWSTGTILAKWIDLGAMAIGVYRFGTFFVMLLIWMRARQVPITLHMLRGSAWGGLALGLDIVLFFSAVKETSIVNATVIGSLQPILVGIIAWRFFGERIRPVDAAWSAVALAGAFLVVRSGANDDITSWQGDLLARGAMFAWSGYFIASRRAKGVVTPQEFTAGTSFWTAVICLPVGLAVGQDMSLPSAENWAWLLVMIASSGVIGHTLMNWSLQRIPLWVGSTFTLFIPVGSAVLAWIFLGEAVSWIQALAMAAVIGALAMIVRGQTGRAARNGPT
ncbi:MAG: DMT family transporter [Actinomycetota bacterium]